MVTSMALSQQYGCSIVTWVSRISQCGVMGLTRESIFLCRVRPKVGSYINGSFRNWTALISLLLIISFPSLESDVPIYNPTIGSTSMLCIYGLKPKRNPDSDELSNKAPAKQHILAYFDEDSILSCF